MRSKFIYVFGLLGVLTTMSACHREYLNPAPQNQISDADAFTTAARISNQVLGLYATLKNGAFYGGRYIVYGDIRGEEFLAQDPNNITNYDVWYLNPTNTATAVRGLWLQAYQVINACNVFIDGMNNKGFDVVGSDLGTVYVSEARLIRAIAYYSLLQYYARPYADGNGNKLGLPLRLTGITNFGSSDMERSSVAAVYTQILADLDFAESKLPLTNPVTSANPGANVTRAHRNTAIAFKTRVYLSMQKYDKVIEEANKIVPTSAPFKAKSGVAHELSTSYTNIFTSYLTTESILSMPFTTAAADAPGTQNDLRSYFYANKSGVGSIFSLNPSGIIGDASWVKTDARRTLLDTSKEAANVGKIYTKKFSVSSSTDYAPVIRWAEVLLNLAEAKARTSALDQQAIDLLNAVRRRSDATTLFTTASFANATSLVNTILTERRIEFLGEGLRNNDLMRLLQTIPAKGVAQAKAPNEDGYIWPASSEEKALNKLWVDQ